MALFFFLTPTFAVILYAWSVPQIRGYRQASCRNPGPITITEGVWLTTTFHKVIGIQTAGTTMLPPFPATPRSSKSYFGPPQFIQRGRGGCAMGGTNFILSKSAHRLTPPGTSFPKDWMKVGGVISVTACLLQQAGAEESAGAA